MEGLLFLLDMVLLIVFLMAVIKAEQANKSVIDTGFFAFRRETTKQEESTKRSPDA